MQTVTIIASLMVTVFVILVVSTLGSDIKTCVKALVLEPPWQVLSVCFVSDV